MDRWGIQIEMHIDIQIVLEAISAGMAVAISDGSFQEQAGSVAWTIESTTKQHQILRFGRTPGMAPGQSAYRSELFRLWGLL